MNFVKVGLFKVCVSDSFCLTVIEEKSFGGVGSNPQPIVKERSKGYVHIENTDF